ncbi:MAG: hypothetical protein ACE5FO_10060 [Parvularculaceae bacterium]
MFARTLTRLAITVIAALATTAPALAGSDPSEDPSRGAAPALNGFTRTVESGVAVYRGRAPAHKPAAHKKGPCDCAPVVRVKTTVKVIHRRPPARVRTIGFFSGHGRPSRSFTHGFFSGRR